MLNNVTLMGRLTADPELRKTTNDKSVVSFSLAVERNYKSEGETQVDFIRCTAWRQTAEFISKYFTKGQMLAVQGALRNEEYTTKSGDKRTNTVVLVDKAFFCDRKSGATEKPIEPSSLENTVADDAFMPLEDDDDLPF